MLTVRPDHFAHLDLCFGQVSAQTRPPSSGPFHPDPVDRSETRQPIQQLAVTGPSSREGGGGQHPAQLIDRRRHMEVFMSVDPAGDFSPRIWHPCHRHSLSR